VDVSKFKIEICHRNILPVFVYKKTCQNQSSKGYTPARLPFNYLAWLLEEPLTKEGHITVVNISHCVQKHPYASCLLFSSYRVN